MNEIEEYLSQLPGGDVADLPGDGVRSRWVYLEAGDAELLLKWNVGNRNIQRSTVEKLRADMRIGKLLTTHQGIAVSADGRVLDGGHRLTAQVEEGADLWWLITTGLNPDAQTRMDIQRRRQAHNFMEGSHTALRSSTLRILVAIQREIPNLTDSAIHGHLAVITPPVIEDELTQKIHGVVERLAPVASSAARNVRLFGPSPLLAAVVARLPEQQGREFLSGLADIEGLRKGDPRMALMRAVPSGRRIQQGHATILALRVASMWGAGQSLITLKPGVYRAVNLSTLSN